MAEITKEKAENLMKIFLPKYNSDFGTNFIFDSLDSKGSDYDILCKDKINKKTCLRVQVVEAVPTRNSDNEKDSPFEENELAALKKFERGEIDEIKAIHLQTDELRIEEALGHKFNKYPSSTQQNLVILIDFGLFPWSEENLSKMKEVARKFKGNFKDIYCIHAGKRAVCEHLI